MPLGEQVQNHMSLTLAQMKNTCLVTSFLHSLVVGVSIGQPAHHDLSVADEKPSFNQECQSIAFKSFPHQSEGVYGHLCSTLSLQKVKKKRTLTLHRNINIEHIL